MTTFIHTADWQLGMTWRRLSAEAQARFTSDRIKTITKLVTTIPGADFMIVAGDVFEHSNLSAADIGRSLEAMGATGIDIYLLPGNHDYAAPGQIWDSPTFTRHKPDNVHVLLEPVVVGDTELVPVPWHGKNPEFDALTQAARRLGPKTTAHRVLVGHGMVDVLEPDPLKDPINTDVLRHAIDEGLIDYVALGDRHICWVDPVSEAIAYPGTHEVTSMREKSVGTALEVSLDPLTLTKHTVGTWDFRTIEAHLETDEDVDRVLAQFDIPGKDTTVIRTVFTGALSLTAMARLESELEALSPLFAGIYAWDRHTDLIALPDEDDLDALQLSGFAEDTLNQLRDEADTNPVAADALKLLYKVVIA